MRRTAIEDSVWVEATCACGAYLYIPLTQARGRASAGHCLCAHYQEAPPWADEVFEHYRRIVSGRNPKAKWETAETDQGRQCLPPRILDRLEAEGNVWFRAHPSRKRPPKASVDPDRRWATFEGFINAVGWPKHPGQRLVKRSKHAPWTASNVAWAFADRSVFAVVVPWEQLALAQRPGYRLVQQRRWIRNLYGRPYPQAHVAVVKESGRM